jgi:putative transposase
VSLLVETEVQELPKTNSYIGMDVGLKDFAILSDGKPIKIQSFSIIRREVGKSTACSF